MPEKVDHMEETLSDVMEKLRAYKTSRMLSVALDAGILAHLAAGPTPVEKIASECGLHPDWAPKLLQGLQECALVACEEGLWYLTPKGESALRDPALKHLATYHRHCYEGWAQLPTLCRGSSQKIGFHQSRLGDQNFVDAYMLMMNAIAEKQVPWLLAECPLRGDILDLGAGPSTFGRALAEHAGCRVSAIDRQEMVACVLRLFAYPQGFTWLAGDFEKLPPTPAYDGIYASHVIEYVPEGGLRHWIQNRMALLKPGGTLAIVSFLRSNECDINPNLTMFELSTGIHGSCLGHIPTVVELSDALKQEGAQDVSCKPIPSGPSYQEYLTLARWL